MKISWIISVCIVFAAYLMRTKATQETAELQAELASLTAVAKDAKSALIKKRESAAQLAASGLSSRKLSAVSAITTELISFYKESKAKGDGPAAPDKLFDLIGRITALSEPELRALVNNVKNSPDLESNGKRDLLRFSVSVLGQADGKAGLQLLKEMKDLPDFGKDQQRGVVATCLASWGKQDPEAALAWLDGQGKDPELKHMAEPKLLASLASKDPAKALEWLRSVTNDNLARMLGQNLKPEDCDKMLAILPAKSGNQDIRRELLNGITWRLMKDSPAVSIPWLEKQDLTMEERTAMLETLPQNFPKSPTPWLEWYGRSTNDPQLLKRVSQHLIPSWTKQNFNAVGEWINTQPKGVFRDQITLEFATTLAPHEPEAAAVWAAQLPEGKERDAVMKKIQSSAKK